MSKAASPWHGKFAFFIGFVALAMLVALLGVWGTLAQISGAVVSSGLLKVESNRQIIQHAEGGIVGEILVRDGDLVEAGDVVLRLEASDVQSELVILESQLIEVSARAARLIAERDGEEGFDVVLDEFDHSAASSMVTGQRNLFAARLQSYQKELEQIDEQIVQTHEQIRGVEAQITANETQLALLEKEIETNETLRKKELVVASKAFEIQRAAAGLEGQTGALIAQRGQLLSAIAGLELDKIRLGNKRREAAITELRDIDVSKNEMMEQRRVLKRKLGRLDITAPSSGVIFGSQVTTVASVITPANPIMYVIPQDQALVVSTRVPSNDIDQVQIGQTASLRFSAFNQKFTPEIFGQVSKVSADILVDETTGMTFYEAEISPNADEMYKLGKQVLIPGMPVEAFIQTAPRSPFSYLIKPMADYFHRAFREE